MKTKTLLTTLLIVLAVIACEKEDIVQPDQSQAEEITTRRGRPDKNPHPPVANAGLDTTAYFPTGPIFLNGSGTDADNNISGYLWTKISGPSSFIFDNAKAARTKVRHLVQGVYQFELKVTDKTNLVDRDTVQVTVNAPIPPPPCITNCGKIVFVSDRDGNSEIYICDDDGSNVTRLTNDAAWDGDPAWSPDGTRIAFTRDSRLFIMNADGSNVVQQTFTSDVGNPTWSPDGTRIAFTDFIGYEIVQIRVMDLNNGAVSGLISTYGLYLLPTPCWSPDGTKIAFDSEVDPERAPGRSVVYTISPEGSWSTILPPIFSTTLSNPSWSPNGVKLSVTSYSEYTPSTQSIAVMTADGTGLTTIKTGIYNHTRTSWSPDGTRIAYTDSNTIKWVASDGSASGIIITNGWDADWKH